MSPICILFFFPPFVNSMTNANILHSALFLSFFFFSLSIDMLLARLCLFHLRRKNKTRGAAIINVPMVSLSSANPPPHAPLASLELHQRK